MPAAADARPHYWSWIVTEGEPRPQRMLPAKRRALVRTRTYGGHDVTAELYAVARAPGFVCVEQDVPGRAPWLAWVREERVTPL